MLEGATFWWNSALERPVVLNFARICFVLKDLYFCSNQKPLRMKKVIVFLILAGLISACSQYTCPTYGKKEAPAKKVSEQKI